MKKIIFVLTLSFVFNFSLYNSSVLAECERFISSMSQDVRFSDQDADMALVVEVWNIVQKESLYKKNLNRKRIAEIVAHTILQSLDKWSRYEDPIEAEKDRLIWKGNSAGMDVPEDQTVSFYQTQDSAEKIYILKIVAFKENTAKQFLSAAQMINKNKPDGIVLDLTDNSGGVMDSTKEICSNIVGSESILAFEENADGEIATVISTSKSEPIFGKTPIVCVVNSNSASAAEFVAACLHDSFFVKLIGEKTHGKCVMQEIVELKSGKGTIVLTFAKWLTPNHEDIQGKGINVDIGSENNDLYSKATLVLERLIEARRYKQKILDDFKK